MNKLNYQGDSKILKNIVNATNELIEGGGGSSVTDVKVNGTSVVDPNTKIASITSYFAVVNGELCQIYDDGN